MCLNGHFFNELSCTCFHKEVCRDLICPDGQALNPKFECQCSSYSDIKALYPEGSSQEDVALSWESGLAKDLATKTSFETGDSTVNIEKEGAIITSGVVGNPDYKAGNI